jgi:glycosyltransferase involved in cell wall biosynthesis
MERVKALISAYYCEPGKGSEEGVGWNTAREIARHHDVWVLTRAKNRPSIEAELSRVPAPGLRFVYCDLPRWGRWWARGQLLEWHLYYYMWQVRAYLVARRLHREVRFDLVHHVTFVKYWTPSFLALLPVPFIWGPVGGGESAPREFWQDFSLRARVNETLRNLGRRFGEHDPFVRLTARRSAVARATTGETAERMLKLGAEGVQVFSQVGLSQEEVEQLTLRASEAGTPLRLISIGRLLHWKGFHLGLRAFAGATLPEEAEYWVVGDGPERRRLEALAGELGIGDRVRFWGALPRADALAKLGSCHVLVHPSLHDSGGGVCLEAMAAGRPVVCLNTGGPATLVTEETGLKVPAFEPEQATRDLSDALTRLARDPELRTRLGEAGRRRVIEAFGWETKGQIWGRLYREVVAR